MTSEIKKLLKERMLEDDETTAHQLHALLISKGPENSLEVFRLDSFRGSAYRTTAHQLHALLISKGYKYVPENSLEVSGVFRLDFPRQCLLPID